MKKNTVIDAMQCAMRELLRRPWRSLILLSGYLAGSAFVFTMAALLHSQMVAKSRIINNMGTHFVAFSPVAYADDNFEKMEQRPLDTKNETFFAEPMVVTRLLPDSLAAEIASIPEVLAATPFLLFRFKQGQDGHVFSVGGFNPADTSALKGTAATARDVISGAFLQPGDRGVVMVEESYALMWDLKVGSVVNVADTLFPIIGILRPGVRPVRADVFMNRVDAEAMISKRLTLPLKQQANLFLVESRGLSQHAEAMKKVDQLLPDGMINTFNCYVPATEVMGMSANALQLIILVVFITVLIFAANSHWASVVERRRDIAILRALGWQSRNILLQILCEAILIALPGSVIGMVSGYAIASLALPAISPSLAMAEAFYFDWSVMAMTLLAFVAVGLISGVFPALQVTSADPAQVLRRPDQ